MSDQRERQFVLYCNCGFLGVLDDLLGLQGHETGISESFLLLKPLDLV